MTTYKDAFYTVSHALCKHGWVDPLEDMGDVNMLNHAQDVLQQHRASHPGPEWLLGAAFGLLHQLRYSDLMIKFAYLLKDIEDLWQCDDALVQTSLQNRMPGILDTLFSPWPDMTASKSPHHRFQLERKLVPNQMLKFVGGGALGMRIWDWSQFPFMQFGLCMNRSFETYSNPIRKGGLYTCYMALSAVLKPDDPNIHAALYSLAHKSRCWLVRKQGCQ